MAKLIITVEGGKITQTLNFLDRNIKDNRYVYGNGNESGIMEEPETIYKDIPECRRITEIYNELLDTLDLGNVQITDIMRRLNELEREMDAYAIPQPENEQEHVITLNNDDLKTLNGMRESLPMENDKHIEEAVKKLIHFINGKSNTPAASSGALDPRGSRPISVQARLPGSLLAEINGAIVSIN